jgi:hypothetical protein
VTAKAKAAKAINLIIRSSHVFKNRFSRSMDSRGFWLNNQDGSRRAETVGVAADPIFGEVRAWIAAMSALVADMIA